MPPIDTESTAAAPGQSPQALWRNGVWRNGVWRNGVWRNGFWSNGFGRQGLSIQGFETQTLRLQGAELTAESSEGTALAGADVVGAELALISGERLTIASYELDAENSELAWYTLTYEGQNICGEGVRGMFVPGVWDPEGARLNADQVSETAAPFSFSCSTGVIAKCVTWGYQPWVDQQAADLHQTCTRLARADYCGDGVAHTENGTLIDVLDFEGIQRQSSEPDELSFEAAWGPNGAVCVNQTRYADTVVKQGPIQPSCWNELPRCVSPAEGEARGATMANFSEQGQRTFCEAPMRY
jgi:hypothetical protein